MNREEAFGIVLYPFLAIVILFVAVFEQDFWWNNEKEVKFNGSNT